MIPWRQLLAKFRDLFRNQHLENELGREIASHLALLEDEFLRRGMTPQGARLAAIHQYGGIEQAKQLHRDERSILWLEWFVQDVKHACRALARSPGFTLVTVITLALGIGVNTTLFTAYDAVALRPLPVGDARKVVRLERWVESQALGDNQYAFSYPEYIYCRDHQDVFSDLVASSWPVTVLASLPEGKQQGDSDPEKLQGQMVSGNYFAGLGIDASIGRTFGRGESLAPGANPVVVLSYAFWQRRFRGESQILGRFIKINGTVFTVIGVTPQEFTGTSLLPSVPDFWAPSSMQTQLVPGQSWLNKPTDFQFQIFARLKSTTGLKHAQAEVSALIHQFSTTYTPLDRTITTTLQRTAFFGNTDDVRFEAGVTASMLIVGMVLLVACVNVANMLLARGMTRQREISLRLALGASRRRVIRHLLTESILLSVGGGIAGLALSAMAGKLLWIAIEGILNQLLGTEFVLSLNLNPDIRVFAYAMGVSVVTGIICGLSPALQFTKADLATSLKDDGTPFGRQISRSRLRNMLVGGQVAIAMLLLTSTGLLVRGLSRSQTADPGFDARRVFLLFVDYGDDLAQATLKQNRLMARLEAVPELKSVALGTGPMMGTWTPPIIVKNTSAVEGVLRNRTLASYASQGYFKTLGITMLRGRDFTKQDIAAGGRVAVISESTARRFWPEDPLGKRFQLDTHFNGKLSEFEVIGIVKDVRFANLTRLDPAHVYLAADPAGIYPLVISVQGDPKRAQSAVRTAVQGFDKNLMPSVSLWNLETMLINPRKFLARALAMLAATLAVLALSLAGIGIYGVMAYVVSQRTHEIGVRIALGATRGHVLGSVVSRVLRPVAGGMMAGFAGGAGISWILHSTLVSPGSSDFLYGVRFYDPWTFLGLSCFLAALALIATSLPVLRALRVEPMVALRYE